MNISVCIITRNQAKRLEKCLSALKNTSFEINVVDTGSTDNTKEIAFRYTERVYDFPWQNDFSLAKNYAISKATNRMILVLDSDEYLQPLDEQILQNELEQYPDRVGRILCRNLLEEDGVLQEDEEYLGRVFNRDNFHYEGKVHEQLVNQKGTIDYETYRSSITILHDGYLLTKEERIQKVRRNRLLLNAEIEEQRSRGIESNIPYLYYQMGKTYFMEQDYGNACQYFEKVLAIDLNPRLEYVIDTVETYGYALLRSNRVKEAIAYERIYPEFGGTADFQFLMGLIYMNNRQFDKAIAEFEKAAINPKARAKSIGEYNAYYNAGVIRECLGDAAAAVTYYGKCKSYDKAMERMKLLQDK